MYIHRSFRCTFKKKINKCENKSFKESIPSFKMLLNHRVFSKIPRLFVKTYMTISCYYISKLFSVNQIFSDV